MSVKRKTTRRPASAQPPSFESTHSDGWQNLITGLGMAQYDRRVSTTFVAGTRMGENELTNIFTDDGFVQRIVGLPADDMVREWFRIEGDTKGSALQVLKNLKAKYYLRRALSWSRLYGGSGVVMGIMDGQTLDKPVNTATIKSVEFLRVYDRFRVWPMRTYADPAKVNYGETEVYSVNPPVGTPYNVHESRILIFDGVDVPDMVRQQNNGWGDSIIQAVYERVRGLGEAYSNVEHIIGEFIIGMLTMNGLAGLIASGQEALVQRRLNQIDMTKHVINSVLLDANEKYERVSSTVAGLPDLIDRLVESVSAVTGIPVTLLMGRSPAGLNATGNSDIRLYYDNISSDQETILEPQLSRIVSYIYAGTQASPDAGEGDWQIIFNPLWQPTSKEQADIHAAQANADKAYIEAGVLSADEVANSRFGGNTYSLDTTLAAPREAYTPDDAAEEEAAAAAAAAEEEAAAADIGEE